MRRVWEKYRVCLGEMEEALDGVKTTVDPGIYRKMLMRLCRKRKEHDVNTFFLKRFMRIQNNTLEMINGMIDKQTCHSRHDAYWREIAETLRKDAFGYEWKTFCQLSIISKGTSLLDHYVRQSRLLFGDASKLDVDDIFHMLFREGESFVLNSLPDLILMNNSSSLFSAHGEVIARIKEDVKRKRWWRREHVLLRLSHQLSDLGVIKTVVEALYGEFERTFQNLGRKGWKKVWMSRQTNTYFAKTPLEVVYSMAIDVVNRKATCTK